MSVRASLHTLVDELPEDELQTAQRLLRSLTDGAEDPVERFLQNAPVDDELVTPAQRRRLNRALEEYRRGETISADEIKRTTLD